MEVLTYCPIRVQSLVVEAEDSGEVVEIWVLRDEVPPRVVHPVVEVGHRDLDPPVIPVANLDMPVHSYWAHVGGALDQRHQAILAITIYHRSQIRRIPPVKESTNTNCHITEPKIKMTPVLASTSISFHFELVCQMQCDLLYTGICFTVGILAAAGAGRAVDDGVVVEGGERDAARRRSLRDELRIRTRHIPRH